MGPRMHMNAHEYGKERNGTGQSQGLAVFLFGGRSLIYYVIRLVFHDALAFVALEF